MSLSEVNSDNFFHHLNDVADMFNLPMDKFLEPRSIDIAICSAEIRDEQAIVVAVLKTFYQEIAAFPEKVRKEPMVLTKKQLDNFLCGWKTNTEMNAETPALLVSEIKTFVSEGTSLLSSFRPEPFLSGVEPIDCIFPEAVHQGKIGNCLFLAALASTAQFRKESVLNVMELDQNHNAKVRFKNSSSHLLRVNALTHGERLLPHAEITPFGAWVRILEKAYGELIRAEVENAPFGRQVKTIAAENTDLRKLKIRLWEAVTVHWGMGLQLFFDKVTLELIDRKKIFDILMNMQEKQLPLVAFRMQKGRQSTAAISKLPFGSLFDYRNHAVAVVGFKPSQDREASTIQIYNQAGANVIEELSLAEFCSRFFAIQRVIQ